MTTLCYPELSKTHESFDTLRHDIIAEMLYKCYKVQCLRGLRLSENRSIRFQYMKDGNIAVYYVTPNAFKKLQNKYRILLNALLD